MLLGFIIGSVFGMTIGLLAVALMAINHKCSSGKDELAKGNKSF